MSTYTRVLVGQATTQTVTLYADGTVTDQAPSLMG